MGTFGLSGPSTMGEFLTDYIEIVLILIPVLSGVLLCFCFWACTSEQAGSSSSYPGGGHAAYALGQYSLEAGLSGPSMIIVRSISPSASILQNLDSRAVSTKEVYSHLAMSIVVQVSQYRVWKSLSKSNESRRFPFRNQRSVGLPPE